MKTSKNFNLQYSIAVFLFSFAFVFVMSGCEKQEQLNPQIKPAIAVDEARLIKSSDASDDAIKSPPVMPDAEHIQPFPKFCFPFAAIKIEHFTTRFNKAEWSVTVNSAGLATFEGKRNCAFHGNVSFNIDPRTLFLVGALYNQSRFNSIVDVLKADSRVPVYATTIFEKYPGWGKTLTDFDDGYPAALVDFRAKVVFLLNVSKYIGTEDQALAVSSVQAL